MKKFLTSILVGVLLFAGGCSNANDNATSNVAGNAEKEAEVELNIAYQYGLAYAPLVVAMENNLIEKAYKELTGKEITVTWHQMSSGADINTGIASGSLNVGFMGVGPAVAGISKNIGYKIFTNLSGQEHSLMTNDETIKSLEDLVGSEKQIALVNIGSIQHIILAKALSDNGLDPHSLDSNIVVMKHPDGLTALESGSIALHLTSSPYTFLEREEDNLYELKEVNEAWTKNDSFIVGIAGIELYEKNPEAYQALCNGINEAIAYTNSNVEDTAKLTAEFDGNEVEKEVEYLKLGLYDSKTSNLFTLAKFMSDNGFIDNPINSYEDLVFDNVEGN